MFDPTGPGGLSDAETYRVNNRATSVSPKLGVVSNTMQSNGEYMVQVTYNTGSGSEQTQPLSVPVRQVGETRGIELGTPVIIEVSPDTGNAILTHVVPTPEKPSVLTEKRDYRVTKGRATIEIIRNDYGQLMLSVGRIGDRQPDNRNVTRSGLDMGLMMNLSSGAFRFFDASGMGLSADGKGNFVWNWASMEVPNALYSGAGTGAKRSEETNETDETTGAQDTSTYGGIGGGSSYENQTPLEDATIVIEDGDSLQTEIESAEDGDVIYFTGEHDLTGNHATLSADNVTLASNRGVETATGGRIFDTSNVGDPTNALINVTGQNALIDSVAFDGESSGINFMQGSTGEVANCSVSGFNAGGVKIVGSGPVETHHCAISNISGPGIRHMNSNQMNVHEFNLFNANETSIRGTGKHGERFTVRDSIFGEVAPGPLVAVDSDAQRDSNEAGVLYRLLNNEMRPLEEQQQQNVQVNGVPTEKLELKNSWIHMRNKELALKQNIDGQEVGNASTPGQLQGIEVANNSWGPNEPTREIGPRI